MANLAVSKDSAHTISVLADDISPIITQSQKLFGILQSCAVYAAADVAVDLWLDNESGRRSLAADLTDVANTGFDALVTNIRYFEEIKLTAESLARDGGTLDMLSRTHGKPEAISTHNRLVQDLQSQVHRCEERAEKLGDQLSAWRRDIMKMQKDIISIRDGYQEEKHEYEKEVKILEAQWKSTQSALNGKLDELEAGMSARAERSRGLTDLAVTTGLAALSLNWRQFGFNGGKLLWALLPGPNSNPDVISKEEIARRLQEGKETEANLTEIQITLEQVSQKKVKAENFNNALKGMTLALAQLVKHLASLVGEFQESLALTATFARDVQTVESNIDYSSEQPVNSSDTELFFETVADMRDRSRRLQYLAMLYARIIKTVMLTGCNAISSQDLHTVVHEPGSGALQLTGNRLALAYSNDSCVSIKEDIDRAYTADSTAAARTLAQRRAVMQKAAAIAGKHKSRFSLFRKKS